MLYVLYKYNFHIKTNPAIKSKNIQIIHWHNLLNNSVIQLGWSSLELHPPTPVILSQEEYNILSTAPEVSSISLCMVSIVVYESLINQKTTTYIWNSWIVYIIITYLSKHTQKIPAKNTTSITYIHHTVTFYILY